jgi:hypothetical protein
MPLINFKLETNQSLSLQYLISRQIYKGGIIIITANFALIVKQWHSRYFHVKMYTTIKGRIIKGGHHSSLVEVYMECWGSQQQR